MSFRLISKSLTLNDLERRNGLSLRYFTEFGGFRGALRKSAAVVVKKSSPSLSHLLMTFFPNADSVSVVSFSSGCGQS